MKSIRYSLLIGLQGATITCRRFTASSRHVNAFQRPTSCTSYRRMNGTTTSSSLSIIKPCQSNIYYRKHWFSLNQCSIKSTINSASSDDTILKEPSPVTTTDTVKESDTSKVHSKVQKPRPLFPWRHSIEPIPRLIKGTKEYIEGETDRFIRNFDVPFKNLFAVYFILRTPINTILWNYNTYKQNLADSAAYAFVQSVAGIISNTYRMPINSIAAEVDEKDIYNGMYGNDEDSDTDEDNTVPVVHFQYPPDSNRIDPKEVDKTFNEELISIVNKVLDIPNEKHEIKKIKTDDDFDDEKKDEKSVPLNGDSNSQLSINSNSDEGSNKATVATLPDTNIDTTDDTVTSSTQTIVHDVNLKADNDSDNNQISQNENVNLKSAVDTPFPISQETKDINSDHDDTVMKSESSPTVESQHPAFVRPYVPKSYKINSTTKTPSSDSTDNGEFCTYINDMMIEPLRKLFTSAHDSGRDQLQIKLQIKPISAKLIGIICLPLYSREDIERGGKILPLEEKARLINPTTVEIQVEVTCWESFQVIDRETGVVLQGSEDGLPQEVTHIVRLETTSYPLANTHTDWKITDIDDMLGHVTWYHKISLK